MNTINQMDKKFMHTIIPVTDGQKVYVSTLKIQKSKYQSKKLPLVTKTINLSKKTYHISS